MDPNKKAGNVFPTQAKLVATYKKEVNADTTLSGLSITLPEKAIGVEFRVESDTTLRMAIAEPATADSGGIAQYDSFSIWGPKSYLETIHLYTGGANDVSIFIYTGE